MRQHQNTGRVLPRQGGQSTQEFADGGRRVRLTYIGRENRINDYQAGLQTTHRGFHRLPTDQLLGTSVVERTAAAVSARSEQRPAAAHVENMHVVRAHTHRPRPRLQPRGQFARRFLVRHPEDGTPSVYGEQSACVPRVAHDGKRDFARECGFADAALARKQANLAFAENRAGAELCPPATGWATGGDHLSLRQSGLAGSSRGEAALSFSKAARSSRGKSFQVPIIASRRVSSRVASSASLGSARLNSCQ